MLTRVSANRMRKSPADSESKTRLIEAGVELFARFSFDGVSTRALANRAKVNLAAIQYYFGGKEGLYLAVARHIVERVGTWSKPVLSKIDERFSTNKPGKDACFLLLCELLDRIMDHALGSQEAKKWMGIFIREQIEPSEAFDILYEGVMGPFHRCLCSLIAAILDLESEGPETKLRAYAVAGQVFIFHISRAEIGRSMTWEAYSPGELHMIRRVVLEQVRALLGIPRETLESYFSSATR
jgi:TetR/AcrR family transcriptional regulator, regulator of cefoperazone and chloramphenicol sensitivity